MKRLCMLLIALVLAAGAMDNYAQKKTTATKKEQTTKKATTSKSTSSKKTQTKSSSAKNTNNSTKTQTKNTTSNKKSQTTNKGANNSKKEQPQQKRTSTTVKQERQETTSKIKQTKAQIEENKKRTRRQLNALNSLNAEVRQNQSEIGKLRDQLQITEHNISVTSDSIDTLTVKVNTIKASASNSLRNARTMQQSMSALSLIFSSENFNQAVKRAGYVKQLDKWRASKTVALKENLAELDHKKNQLSELRQQQANMIAELDHRQKKLDTDVNETQKLVTELKKQGKNLENELVERNKQLKKLDAELDRIIAEEARIAAEKERQRLAEEKRRKEAEERRLAEQAKKKNQQTAPDKPQDAKKTDNKPATPPKATQPLPANSNFAQLKGKLGSPMEGSAKVVGQFGRSKHGDLSKVEIDNPGIDIEGKQGARAVAVYDGIVSSIFYLDGYHNIVMLRHGEYLTVYANVDKLSVKKGDAVKTGQPLGVVYTDPTDSNRTILHFEVRHEREKLNPMLWIRL